MKKLLTILVLCSALGLGACQSGNIFASIENPVSNNSLGAAISTYGVLQTAVIAYRGLPRCTVAANFSATNICYKRSVLVQAQIYDKAANVAINEAVDFQRKNPTLDATSYVTAALAAIDAFKSFAVQSKLPGVS